MRAVLAAAARAALVAVMVLAVLAGSVGAAYGPQGLWVMAWLAAMLAVILGAGLGLHALRPKNERGGTGEYRKQNRVDRRHMEPGDRM